MKAYAEVEINSANVYGDLQEKIQYCNVIVIIIWEQIVAIVDMINVLIDFYVAQQSMQF